MYAFLDDLFSDKSTNVGNTTTSYAPKNQQKSYLQKNEYSNPKAKM